MNHFSIKDIENLSGIKAHTWRIWEQRYPIVSPHRKESNHRFYDSEDLKKVLRISFLYHQGVKISKLATLEDDALEAMTIEMLSPLSFNKFQVKQLAEASFDFDEERFNSVMQISIAELGLEQTVLQVVFPFLQKVGNLWLTNHVIPAQEHFVSNVIMHHILVGIDGLSKKTINNNKRIVLFTPEKEHHEIPLLFTNYLLKKQGIKTVYLGQNISMQTLQTYFQEKPYTHLFFHLITNLSGKDPSDYLEKLSEQFPTVQIIMAGSETAKISTYPKNSKLLKNSDEILAFIGNM